MSAIAHELWYKVTQAAMFKLKAHALGIDKGFLDCAATSKEQMEQAKDIIASMQRRLMDDPSKMTAEECFRAFTRELENLSKQYGIVIHSTGGVEALDSSDILRVKYSNDLSSGDLENQVIWKVDENKLLDNPQ